ncbi:hypothetical protein SAMN04489835_4081 [Mycolicibacterium rutilum]|uniref:Uncharacterized protein n=1 Tax=Mycolicibacterium rutilum TaxID=370526 RepID=A0A1H6KZC3_MYCRU|nr:hypothetical protein SAMN04489835_4081 [Mycolicibacterium rutilum]
MCRGQWPLRASEFAGRRQAPRVDHIAVARADVVATAGVMGRSLRYIEVGGATRRLPRGVWRAVAESHE